MALCDADPVVRNWWSYCEPCQDPLHWEGPPPSQSGTGGPGGAWWDSMACLNHCGACAQCRHDNPRHPLHGLGGSAPHHTVADHAVTQPHNGHRHPHFAVFAGGWPTSWSTQWPDPDFKCNQPDGKLSSSAAPPAVHNRPE